ncbi:methionyl-tRNA synthetase [Capsaspora owczarzaki ATCC 30864]|uniref:methionyl-tRNA synthetase n=1 Tax=Capsaspora owczarzaki (strain ATCC 30864) TaxID=595528 RepID=UPI0003523C27|nr:methionyl-tRNA synthetase [Capsaspora owczarzaki ATCC 30864]|eukprot:XP_004365688.2 methionyl-tRNA synthetase [Capsaspora owczarzaki ATCC 30864]
MSLTVAVLDGKSLAALKVEHALALRSTTSSSSTTTVAIATASEAKQLADRAAAVAPATTAAVVLALDERRTLVNPNAIAVTVLGQCTADAATWIQLDESRLASQLAVVLAPPKVPALVTASKAAVLAALKTIASAITAAKGQPLSDAAHVVLGATLFPAFHATGAFALEAAIRSQVASVEQYFQKNVFSTEAFRQALAKTGFADDSALAAHVAALSATAAAVLPSKASAVASAAAPAPAAAVTHHQPAPDAKTGIVDLDIMEKATPKELEDALSNWTKDALPTGKVGSDPTAPIPGQVLLPKPDQRNILITSALPYVNNVPHLGNIIGCVLSADVYARFCRERGYNTLYICGTDEYGTATETKALEEGLTPQQICDKYHKLHREIYEYFQISFDHFGRTTTPQQTEISQDIFLRALKNDTLLEESVEQLLCETCNRYLADRFVEGICPSCKYDDARGDQCDKCGKLLNAVELVEPRCKLCRSRPVVRPSRHMFLNLPMLDGQIKEWYAGSSVKGDWTASAKHITSSWLKEGVKPRCITRDLKWGVPVPLDGFREKVFYVWFDAPIGYISITAAYTAEWEKWWKNPSQVQLYQFMAKDNVPFHSIIFPASQLAAKDNYTLVHHISAVEFLNYEDGKFSKSRGVGVFGNHARDTGLAIDIFRFYLLGIRPEYTDSVFSWTDLASKVNNELLANLGNLVQRSLSFIKANFAGKVPKVVLNVDTDAQSCNFVALVNRYLREYIDLLEQVHLRDALRLVLKISSIANQYFQTVQPWKTIKLTDDLSKQRTATCLGLCANFVHLLSTLLFPFMPVTGKKILEQLNAAPGSLRADHWGLTLPEGHEIGTPSVLFEKIEPAVVETLRAKYGGKQEGAAAAGPVSVTESAALKKSKTQQASSPQPAAGTAAAGSSSTGDVAALTAKVDAQGNLVRKLKGEKADKAKIDAEVKVLLDLKSQLERATKAAAAAAPVAAPSAAPAASASAAPSATTKALEDQIAVQGNKVRDLKSQKADKAVVTAEVNILLALKQQLASLSK